MQEQVDDKSNQIKSDVAGQTGPMPKEANKASQVLTRPIILGDLTLGSPTTNTTIGANGAATALTANPVGYLTVMIGNTAYQMPYYNVA